MLEDSVAIGSDHVDARPHARKLRDFHALIVTAALICALTFPISWMTSPHRWWFFWVALAIATSAIGLSVVHRLFGPARERCQIERQLGGG